MKKQGLAPFLLISLLFLCLSTGLSFGRNLALTNPAPISPKTQSSADSQVLDLNQADLQQLMTLPGIGQTLATRIIDYRNTHGSFTSVAELLNIDGIGEGRLEALLPHITAGG